MPSAYGEFSDDEILQRMEAALDELQREQWSPSFCEKVFAVLVAYEAARAEEREAKSVLKPDALPRVEQKS